MYRDGAGRAELHIVAKGMKVFVAVPSYDAKLNSSCAQSLLKAAYHCAKQDIELQPSFIHGGIFIDNARSLMVKEFLTTDCTHFFFIDADIGFESDALAGLVLADNPISLGVYPRRDPDGGEVSAYNANFHFPEEVSNGWIRVDRAATGFMCIRRDVLEVMSEKAPITKLAVSTLSKYGGPTPMVFHVRHDGTFIGEDYCFCDDYNELYKEGVFDQPIWAYPDINFDHDGILGNLHESLLENNEVPGLTDAC